jgi:uncharacterized protein YegL
MATDDNMQVVQIPGGGNFQFSGIRPENLGATEYTLVTVVVDLTGSVGGFEKELMKCLKSIVKACRKSPRAENLLLRLVTFNSKIGVKEEHGFKPLSLIDENTYQNFIVDGATNLYDATYEPIGATLTYSKTLMDQDFNVNGAVYILTDGDNNASHFATPAKIKKQLENVKKQEIIESLITVLVGINAQQYNKELALFQNDSGLTQFVDAGDATPQKLAKLANFVSKSISSQSQALGSGTPSQPLSF